MSPASSLATDPQRTDRRRIKLISDYQTIGIYLDSDTPLDEIPTVDKLTRLRILATKHRRAISNLDLTNPTVIDRELDRLMMLEGRARRRGSYRTIRFTPAPVKLTTEQLKARASQARQVRDGRYAPGRFPDSFGYGSHASRSIQQADARNMGPQPLIRQATDSQAAYIKTLAAQRGVNITPPARFDLAQELINNLKGTEPAPSKAQTRYLADLQRKLGLPPTPAATKAQASSEIDRLLAIRNTNNR